EQAASHRVVAFHVAVPTRRHHRGGGAIGGHCDPSQTRRHAARFRGPRTKGLQEPRDVLARGSQARHASGQLTNALQSQPPVFGRRSPGSRTSRRNDHIRAIFGAEVSETHMNRLVDRYGRTGVAAITSIIWLLPFAAWAGAADLSPIDRTATPTTAFSIGVVMLALWLVLVANLGRFQVTARQRRFHITQMSPSEKRWTLGVFAFALGLIAWLNGTATVDCGPLVSEIGAGAIGSVYLASALSVYDLALVA